MSDKLLDLNKNLHDLTEQYPELIGLLKDLGFAGVTNPVARNTVGRMTTIPEGSKRQGKDIGEVIKKLEEAGFKIKLPESDGKKY